MSVEINSALVAKIADGFVKAPRLACEEFHAIVSEFRALHSEFKTRVADAYSEYLHDHIELHHSDEYFNLTTGPCYRDLDVDVLRAMWDDNYQELVESLSQHVKEQIFSKAMAAASEHSNTRAIEIACRGELFCRTIEMATIEKADPFELAGTSRLRTIVCQDLIPIGHPEWWKSVFDPAFKSVEANFRTFTDRVAFIEYKARAPAGPWPEADRDAIRECLSGQQLKLFNVLWSSDKWTSYKTLKSNRADKLWRGQPDPNHIDDGTVFEALRKLQGAIMPLGWPYSVSIQNESKRVRIFPPEKPPT